MGNSCRRATPVEEINKNSRGLPIRLNIPYEDRACFAGCGGSPGVPQKYYICPRVVVDAARLAVQANNPQHGQPQSGAGGQRAEGEALKRGESSAFGLPSAGGSALQYADGRIEVLEGGQGARCWRHKL